MLAFATQTRVEMRVRIIAKAVGVASVVPWRPHDPKVDCRWAARDLSRRHDTGKTRRATSLPPKVAWWDSQGANLHLTILSPVSFRQGKTRCGFNASLSIRLSER